MVVILHNLWGRIRRNPVEEGRILTAKPEQLQETFKKKKIAGNEKVCFIKLLTTANIFPNLKDFIVCI